MSDNNTAAYYRAREEQERALVARATSPAIASIHRDLAEGYSVLADRAAVPAQRPMIRPLLPP